MRKSDVVKRFIDGGRKPRCAKCGGKRDKLRTTAILESDKWCLTCVTSEHEQIYHRAIASIARSIENPLGVLRDVRP